MIPGVITPQTGAREYNAPDMTKYSMFVGGLNATNHALRNYSPQLNGYGRLFMVRPPMAILRAFAGDAKNLYSSDNLFIQFKHMLEYMNRSVTGFGAKTLVEASTPIQGGFAGRKFSLPTVTQDETNAITISLYELQGSPVSTVIDFWMNAIGDENSGLATYGGYISGGTVKNGSDAGKEKRLYARSGEDPTDGAFAFNEANHTAEFIYAVLDRSGAQVEKAVLLADCWPKNLEQGKALDMAEGGVHDAITYDLTFNCVCYRSPIINAIANDLVKQYRIVSNSLNFNPELGDAVYGLGTPDKLSRSLGPVPTDSATGTNIGNMPVYDATTEPTSKTTDYINANTVGKMGGQGNQHGGISWDGFADS